MHQNEYQDMQSHKSTLHTIKAVDGLGMYFLMKRHISSQLFTNVCFIKTNTLYIPYSREF